MRDICVLAQLALRRGKGRPLSYILRHIAAHEKSCSSYDMSYRSLTKHKTRNKSRVVHTHIHTSHVSQGQLAPHSVKWRPLTGFRTAPLHKSGERRATHQKCLLAAPSNRDDPENWKELRIVSVRRQKGIPEREFFGVEIRLSRFEGSTIDH